MSGTQTWLPQLTTNNHTLSNHVNLVRNEHCSIQSLLKKGEAGILLRDKYLTFLQPTKTHFIQLDAQNWKQIFPKNYANDRT